METKDYKEIIRFLEEELMDCYHKAKQNPTPDSVGVIKTILSGIAKAETITAMRGESEYSGGNGWYYQDGEYSGRRNYRMNGGQSNRRYYEDGGQSNDGGQSERSYYRRGRYSDGQSNDGGNSYHDEDMTEYLRKRVRSEQDDRRRSAFEDMLRMMENR